MYLRSERGSDATHTGPKQSRVLKRVGSGPRYVVVTSEVDHVVT